MGKPRRHHNNKGYRQIKNGGTSRSLRAIARRLGLIRQFRGKPWRKGQTTAIDDWFPLPEDQS